MMGSLVTSVAYATAPALLVMAVAWRLWRDRKQKWSAIVALIGILAGVGVFWSDYEDRSRLLLRVSVKQPAKDQTTRIPIEIQHAGVEHSLLLEPFSDRNRLKPVDLQLSLGKRTERLSLLAS